MAEEQQYKLGKWGVMALRHWKEHRPKMYRELEKKGLLRKAAYEAEQRTEDVLCDLIEGGMDPYQAEEIVREMWVLLPDEEDVPHLGEGQDPLRYAHGTYVSTKS